ncbi:GNAT family N-acetyltransferase [Curtobacterium sp. PhB146]|uniref:GNAT family N-acetyltransferase n=1 Tax=Curtobacterium sp. PhB146 TaxID=2485187 RepID=UPI00104AE413|nr:GNAT family N-acetyltransferase [Curtobacterium sp. PhB146]TCU42310.1 RimJ/RimL family protein N-acetyltransferase [Curtobacterium sp. PhB146]
MPVSLRPWSRSDAPALLAARWSSPDLDTQFAGAHLSDEAQAADYVGEIMPYSDSAKNWAIVEDGIAVGNVGLSAIERRHQTAWAYYWLAGGARGRGYASQALRAVADWGFHSGLFRLELGHRVHNPASCRVASAAGFLAEGIERQKLRYGAERFDVETHARLASDPYPAGSAFEFQTAE